MNDTPYVSALINRPKHLQAIGLLSVEIARLERSIGELLGTILGMHVLVAEAIYFTPNANIARMDIVSNVAPLVLNKYPRKVKRINRFIQRAKAVMGKRHEIIHAFWVLAESGENIRREKMGAMRVHTVTLTDLESQVLDAQKLTFEIERFCAAFRDELPKQIGPLKEYWKL
jgi:hypothetical protein